MDYVHPDLPLYHWKRALMGIRFETCGSAEGFNLANSWSSERKNYCGTQKLKAYWRTLDVNPPKPITIGTLVWLAHQYPKD
jgi:hypothetical protein